MQILIRLLKVLLSILWFPLAMIMSALVVLFLFPLCILLFTIGYILFGPNAQVDLFGILVLIIKLLLLPFFLIWEYWDETMEPLRD